ncbi:unnamed protein product, partial [Iphiclides podalirius]
MASNEFMDKIRSFFGLRVEPPRNDFRNPIWSTDDDDDDELYNRQQIDVFKDSLELHRELTRHMQEMFSSFGSMFGDMKTFLHDGAIDSFVTDLPVREEPEQFVNSSSIRDYYLKPGYQNNKNEHLEGDKDLDGKISSHEISGLLKNNDDRIVPSNRYDNVISGRPFCQTIITTSVTKPDGSTETRRIVKKGNEVIEETITTTDPTSYRNPNISDTSIMASTAGASPVVAY